MVQPPHTAACPCPRGVAESRVRHAASWEDRAEAPAAHPFHLCRLARGPPPPEPRLTRCSWLGTPYLNLPLPPRPCYSASPEPSCCALLLFQWDLVCDYQSLKPMVQSIYMVGVLLGSFCWGLLSDR